MWEGLIYNVLTGSEVEIGVYDHNDGTQDSENRFISCSDQYWMIVGYNDEYALVILVKLVCDSGKYEIIFTENNGENAEIQIRRREFLLKQFIYTIYWSCISICNQGQKEIISSMNLIIVKVKQMRNGGKSSNLSY